ncbi:IS110 family transposase [Raoultibacter timonensis]|uniref:IS110 family transposase n=1 Tax=Raoultibacter timonensis TaxID=1907662 RepID=UPI000C866821|nr:transposase [Raoultibacter timonensis]
MKRSEIVGYDVFCGIDVGKASHCMVALDRNCGKPLTSGSAAQDEAEIRKALAKASRLGGARMLVTVDQCGSFGRPTVAVAKDMGMDVAHIPPRKFRQVAETYGEDKTDVIDAFIIADTARSAPRNIELVGDRPEAAAESAASRTPTIWPRMRAWRP